MTNKPQEVWASGDTYEPYVGRWSRLVAKQFLERLNLPSIRSWLDVVTGTAPSSIVFTANPSSIPNGNGLSGHVIVSANSLSQTITIPAGIVVGSLFDKPIASTSYKVLLPLIRK
jgi:hypothetical protein